MDQDEIAAELSQAGAQQILRTTFAHLAYTAVDGTPRVVPVGFLWTGGGAVVCTAPTSPKVPALSARPDVALAIEDGGTSGNAQSLSIRGRATLAIVDGVAPEYLTMARRSRPPDDAAEFEKQVREMYDQQVVITIRPTWARYYDFGAGRLPKFLQELSDRSRS